MVEGLNQLWLPSRVFMSWSEADIKIDLGVVGVITAPIIVFFLLLLLLWALKLELNSQKM